MPDLPDRHDAATDELRRRVTRVRAAERAELVGQLAEAVSHDLNNALGVITTYSNLLMADAVEGSEQWEDLNSIFDAARRVGELTRWLNLFAQEPDPSDDRYRSLVECVRSVEKVGTKFLATGGLETRMELGDEGPPVDAPMSSVGDLLLGLLAEVRWSLRSGTVTVRVDRGPGEDSETLLVRAAGEVNRPPPPGGISLLAPGPHDFGTDEALKPLDALARDRGGHVSRSETEDGFELSLVLPVHRSD